MNKQQTIRDLMGIIFILLLMVTIFAVSEMTKAYDELTDEIRVRGCEAICPCWDKYNSIVIQNTSNDSIIRKGLIE